MTRLLRAVVTASLVLSSIVLAAQEAAAATATVCASGCDFTTVQAAIDASSPGDLIVLGGEFFNEGFTVDRPLTIVGPGFDNPNQPQPTFGDVVTVTATNGVVRFHSLWFPVGLTSATPISLLEITNSTFSGTTDLSGAERIHLVGNTFRNAVRVHDAGAVEAHGNAIISTELDGLLDLEDLTGPVRVEDNTIDGVATGVRARSVAGLDLQFNTARDTTGPAFHLGGAVTGQVHSNEVTSGEAEGILLSVEPGGAANDVVINLNRFTATRGIVVDDDAQVGNLIFQNDVSGNTEAGVINHDPDHLLDATCSYWGVPNGPSVPTFDTGGALAVGLLDVEPWAISPVDIGEFCRGLPRITIVELPAEQAEGDDTHAVPLTFELIDGPVYRPVTLVWRTGGPLGEGECSDGSCAAATADQDYVATGGELVFQPGDVTKAAEVTILGDATAELPEVVRIGGGAALGGDACFGRNPNDSPSGLITCDYEDYESLTLLNDDEGAVITVSATAAPVTEGDSGTRNLPVTFTLSAPQPTLVQVAYETTDFTALRPSDYEARSGVMGFGPGQTTATLNFKVVGDTVSEEPTEAFILRLTGATGAAIATPEVTLTIVDDDPPVISATAQPVAEGDSGTRNAPVTFTLSKPWLLPVRVSFSTRDDATASTADYVTRTGRLGFAPGQTTATINIQIQGDRLLESAEELSLLLEDPTEATLASARVPITITDDDFDKPIVGFATFPVVERDTGTRNLPVTFTLSEPLDTAILVPFATADWFVAAGSATAGEDYEARSGTLGFAPGQTTATLNFKVIGDTVPEGEELFRLLLSSPTAEAVITTDYIALTITDDDA